MSLGTLLVIIAIVLAVISPFTGPAWLLVAAVVCGFVGVLVGAAPINR